MSNLYEFKNLINENLHENVFQNDPTLLDSNVYINKDFSGTLQQLFIIRNWAELLEKISEEELWAFIKLHEYRQTKIVFDGSSGDIIADESAQELYKKYYYNSIWLKNRNHTTNNTTTTTNLGIDSYFIKYTIVIIVFLSFIVYCIFFVWQRERIASNNLLDILELSTKAQQIK